MKSVKITRDVKVSSNNKMFDGDLIQGAIMEFPVNVADSLINRDMAEAVEEEKTVEKEAPKKAKAKAKAKTKPKATAKKS